MHLKKRLVVFVFVVIFIFASYYLDEVYSAGVIEATRAVKPDDWSNLYTGLSPNTFTGDLSYSVPLVSFQGGKGPGFSLALGYNSDVKKVLNSENKDGQSSEVGLGWNLNVPSITPLWKHPAYLTPPPFFSRSLYNYVVNLPSGSTIITSAEESCEAPNGGRCNLFYSIDDPLIKANLYYEDNEPIFEVYAPDGTIYKFDHRRNMVILDGLVWDPTNNNKEFSEWDEPVCFDVGEGGLCNKNYNAFSGFNEQQNIRDFVYKWDLTEIVDPLGNWASFYWYDDMETYYYYVVKNFRVGTGCEEIDDGAPPGGSEYIGYDCYLEECLQYDPEFGCIVEATHCSEFRAYDYNPEGGGMEHSEYCDWENRQCNPTSYVEKTGTYTANSRLGAVIFGCNPEIPGCDLQWYGNTYPTGLIENTVDGGYAIKLEYEDRLDWQIEDPNIIGENSYDGLCEPPFKYSESNMPGIYSDKRLKEVKLLRFESTDIGENEAEILQKVSFDYNYIGTDDKTKLFLNGVSAEGINGATMPPFIFNYNNNGMLQNVKTPLGGRLSVSYQDKTYDFTGGNGGPYVENVTLGEADLVAGIIQPRMDIDISDKVAAEDNFGYLTNLGMVNVAGNYYAVLVGEGYQMFLTDLKDRNNLKIEDVYGFGASSTNSRYVVKTDIAVADDYIYTLNSFPLECECGTIQVNKVVRGEFSAMIREIDRGSSFPLDFVPTAATVYGNYLYVVGATNGYNGKLAVFDITNRENIVKVNTLNVNYLSPKDVVVNSNFPGGEVRLYVSGSHTYNRNGIYYYSIVNPASPQLLGSASSNYNYYILETNGNYFFAKAVDVYTGVTYVKIYDLSLNEKFSSFLTYNQGFIVKDNYLLFVYGTNYNTYDFSNIQNVKLVGDFSEISPLRIERAAVIPTGDYIYFIDDSSFAGFSLLSSSSSNGYRVSQIDMEDGTGDIVTRTFSYSKGNYDTPYKNEFYSACKENLGSVVCRRTIEYPNDIGYGDVSIIIPGRGKTEIKYFNKLDEEVCPDCPQTNLDYPFALKGRSYETINYNENGNIVSKENTNLEQREWKTNYGSAYINSIASYPVSKTEILDGLQTNSIFSYDWNNLNYPLPRKVKTLGNDYDKVSYALYSQELYSEMRDKNMLTQAAVSISGHEGIDNQPDTVFSLNTVDSQNIDSYSYSLNKLSQNDPWYPYTRIEGSWIDSDGDKRFDGDMYTSSEAMITKYNNYDSYGRVTRFTDTGGFVYNLIYEGDNDPCNDNPGYEDLTYNKYYPTCFIDPLGNREINKYNSIGKVKSYVDKNSQETIFNYDDLWRSKSVKFPGVNEPTLSFNYYYAEDLGGISPEQLNSVETVTKLNPTLQTLSAKHFDGLGRTQQNAVVKDDTTTIRNTLDYEDLSLVSEISDWFEDGSQFTGGKLNLMSSGEIANLNENVDTSRTFYYNDPLGRIEKTYPLGENPDAGGVYVKTEYSGEPNYYYVSVSDEKNIKTKTKTDKLGRTIEAISALDTEDQSATRTTYDDAFGFSYKVTNAENQETEFRADSLGRIRAIKNPDFNVRRNLKYDSRGNIILSGEGCRWQASGEVAGGHYKVPSAYECSKVIGYVYDSLNRVKCIDYNPPNIDSWGGTDCTDAEIKYYYDSYSPNAPDCSQDPSFNYPKGRLVEISDSYNSDYKSCYYYDAKGQLRKEIRKIDNSPYELNYNYDDAGNIIQITYPNNLGIVNYEYDRTNKLDKVKLNGNVVSDYDYYPDNMLKENRYGNSVLTSYQYNPRNFVEEINTQFLDGSIVENYRYDQVGNLKYLDESYNDALKSTEFSYDNLHRLENVLPISGGGRFKQSIDYDYDLVGNMKNMNNVQFTTLTGKNKLSSITNPAGTIAYYYDDYGNINTESGWQEIDFYKIKYFAPQSPPGGGGKPKPYDLALPPGNLKENESVPSGDSGTNISNLSNDTKLVSGAISGKQNIPSMPLFSLGDTGTQKTYILYGIDAEVGDTIRVVHSVNNPSGVGNYPYTGTYVWETRVEEYSGILGPFCDQDVAGEFVEECVLHGEDIYETAAVISQSNVISGNPPAGFFEPGFQTMKPFFKIYKQKTNNYCFDYSNRLSDLWETDQNGIGSCMRFEYDDAGSRIKKIESTGVGGKLENVNLGYYSQYVWDIDYDTSDDSVWIAQQVVKQVKKYNEDGTSEFQFALNGENDEPYGITTGGAYVYVTEKNPRKVYKYNRNTGAFTYSISLGQNFDSVAGMDFDNGKLWIADSAGYKIHCISSADGSNCADLGGAGYFDTKKAHTGLAQDIKPIGVSIFGDYLIVHDVGPSVEAEPGKPGTKGFYLFSKQGLYIRRLFILSDDNYRGMDTRPNYYGGSSLLVKQGDSGGVVNYYSLEKNRYGVASVYVTQGNNVIYEKRYPISSFVCATSCQDYGFQGSPSFNLIDLINRILFSKTEDGAEKPSSKLSSLFAKKSD